MRRLCGFVRHFGIACRVDEKSSWVLFENISTIDCAHCAKIVRNRGKRSICAQSFIIVGWQWLPDIYNTRSVSFSLNRPLDPLKRRFKTWYKARGQRFSQPSSRSPPDSPMPSWQSRVDHWQATLQRTFSAYKCASNTFPVNTSVPERAAGWWRVLQVCVDASFC